MSRLDDLERSIRPISPPVDNFEQQIPVSNGDIEVNVTTHTTAAAERQASGLDVAGYAVLRIGLAAVVLSAGMAFNHQADLIGRLKDKLADEKVAEEGSVQIGDLYALPFTNVQFEGNSIAMGRAKDDVTAQSDPEANRVVDSVSEIKIRTKYPLGARVIKNPELAAIAPDYEHILVISTYDSSGNDAGLELDKIIVEPLYPESCWFDKSKSDITGNIEFEGCRDPSDRDYQGRAYSSATEGGPFWGNDGHIYAKAKGAAVLMQHNNNCLLASSIGGRLYNIFNPVTGTFDMPVSQTEPEYIFDNVYALFRANERLAYAEAYSVPVTHVFFADEYEYLLANPNALRDQAVANQYYEITEAVRPSGTELIKKILDPPVIRALADANIEDVRLEMMFPDAVEPYENSLGNAAVCMPRSEAAYQTIKETEKIIDTYALPPWSLQAGDFGRGPIDTARAQDAVERLEAML